MEYSCGTCKYSTDNVCNFKRHISSKKHTSKDNFNPNECEHCGMGYSSSSSLSRHKKICNKKINSEKEEIKNEDLYDRQKELHDREKELINQYKELLEMSEKRNKSLMEENDILKRENNIFRLIGNSTKQ